MRMINVGEYAVEWWELNYKFKSWLAEKDDRKKENNGGFM